MKQIRFATTNLGKVNSLTNVLSEYGIEVIHENMELPESRAADPQDVVLEKVGAAYARLHKPVVAGDSGFYIHALNGFPGTFINFVLKTIGIEGILKLVEGRARECEFRDCLAYCDSSENHPKIFESQAFGTLADSPRGEMTEYAWSALALIFIPAGASKTLAEMSPDEYQEFKMQGHKDFYVARFAKWFIDHDSS